MYTHIYIYIYVYMDICVYIHRYTHMYMCRDILCVHGHVCVILHTHIIYTRYMCTPTHYMCVCVAHTGIQHTHTMCIHLYVYVRTAYSIYIYCVYMSIIMPLYLLYNPYGIYLGRFICIFSKAP